MSLEPQQLLAEVDEGADRLEAAANEFYKATRRFEIAEHTFERAMAHGIVNAYHSKDDQGKRPAEDVRKAKALLAMDEEIQREYGEARADKEAQAVGYRALAAAVSARQSLLKAMGG